jgi:hypothetical protein
MHMNASIPTFARSLALIAIVALVAACGGKDEESAASTDQAPAAETQPSAAGETAPATAGPTTAGAADETAKDERLANAVVTGKTAAAVDLKYDVLAKPDVGQPFEIELVFLPRAAADSLSVEVTGMEGLILVSGVAHSFDNVLAGERYAGRILLRSDTAGVFYVGVVAKLISKVQTEVRTFSIPVVVGTAPAAATKTAPETDASGQPVESLPAVETGGPAEPEKR